MARIPSLAHTGMDLALLLCFEWLEQPSPLLFVIVQPIRGKLHLSLHVSVQLACFVPSFEDFALVAL